MRELPVIRPGTDRDGPAIASLIRPIFAEYAGCRFVPEEFPELAAIATHHAARGGLILVAEAGAALVGSAGLSLHGPTAEVHKMYVARPYRGTGLAARLLSGVLDGARARGATRSVLWSDTRFLAGHRFYEKAGYVRTGRERALADVSATREFEFARESLEPAPGSGMTGKPS